MSDRLRTSARARALAAAVAFIPFTALGGPLDPPVGAVAPTMKTLDQVEPRVPIGLATTPGDATATYVIDEPGSYYLTGNLIGAPGKHGIRIAASQVSIDLCGFMMVGNATSLDGVTITTSAVHDLQLKNGMIRNWPGSGVNLALGSLVSISDLVARDNGVFGIRADDYVILERCRAITNGSTGVRLGDESIVTSSGFFSNGEHGLRTDRSCVIRDSIARDNVEEGFLTGSSAAMSNCMALENDGRGMLVGTGSTLTGCVARGNGEIGFSVNFAGTFAQCAATGNGDDGFQIGSNSTIIGCASYQNRGDGISAFSSCLIRDNTCDENGFLSANDGANIYVTGTENRIDGNAVSGADRGIDIAGFGNIIMKNTASGNTVNYDIAANNRYGPIVDITATGTPAVVGDAAPGTLDSLAPFSNFAY